MITDNQKKSTLRSPLMANIIKQLQQCFVVMNIYKSTNSKIMV